MPTATSPAQLLPRSIRPVPDPLALYLHVGRNDHGSLLDLISQRSPQCFGFIFEATLLSRHRELRELVLARRFDAILDPRTQPAATVGGYTSEIAKLPWAKETPHTPEDFAGSKSQRVAALIADCVMKHGFTAVLAPTHLIDSSSNDWFAIDCDSTLQLREQLNARGGHDVQILYSLAMPYAVFRDPVERRALILRLRQLPIDAVWLRIDGLGANATSHGALNYIVGADEFSTLGVPVIADGMGGLVGLGVLAFGAAGGVAHGVTFGERVDTSSWRRARGDSSFGPTRGVYLTSIDLMLKPKDADALLRSSPRAHTLLACHDSECCPRGRRDMIELPARHFLIQRMRQVTLLGRIPAALRANRFLEDHLRPATEDLMQATNLKLADEDLTRRLAEQRKRFDVLRGALGQLARERPRERQITVLPKMRLSREPRINP